MQHNELQLINADSTNSPTHQLINSDSVATHAVIYTHPYRTASKPMG